MQFKHINEAFYILTYQKMRVNSGKQFFIVWEYWGNTLRRDGKGNYLKEGGIEFRI